MYLLIILNVRDCFDIIIGLAQIIGALATAGAFWVTYWTLRELKRQTDLANNPILKLRFRSYETLENQQYKILGEHLDLKPFQNWLRIITRNLQQDLSGLKDDYLTLEFTNSGKSEITEIHFTLSLLVSMFNDLSLGYDINPTPYEWPKEIHVDLGEKEKVVIPVTNTRYFPIYTGVIKDLYFKDIRGNKYSEFDGLTTIEKKNEILIPTQPQGEPLLQEAVEPTLEDGPEPT